MAILIGHASIDENGKISGGKKGDQTGREICTRSWYSKKWNVYLEPKNEDIAEKAVSLMKAICSDSSFGYSQTARWTGYDAIIKNGGKVDGTVKGDFDCSSLVSAVYAMAGVNLENLRSLYTGNMKRAFEKTGLFMIYTDEAHLKSDKYAKKGGIFLNEGSHVVLALEDGSEAGKAPASSTQTTGGTGKVNIELDVLKKGAKGSQVLTLQRLLRQMQYRDQNGAQLELDGSFGAKTLYAVKNFQQANKLAVDGSVGKATWSALLK